MLPILPPAVLTLADGTVFLGHSIGAAGATVGEVVFNTALTGYQEILTDPSYTRQIVTLTYPHIGNTGVNPQDTESTRVFAAGLIIKDLPLRVSNFRRTASLAEYLQAEGTVGIAGIDTRRLTRRLRTTGAQNGCIRAFPAGHTVSQADIDGAVQEAQRAPSMAGLDLAQVVTTAEPHTWTQGEWRLQGAEDQPGFNESVQAGFHVLAYDFGVKRNILRLFAGLDCKVTVVPATISAEDIMALNPDGVFLSNGPGDPAATGEYAVPVIQNLVQTDKPVFGICLGHQMLGLALGGKTEKMHQGHHGANHPVKDFTTGKVEIVSMNHGFAVDSKSLPESVEETHISLFDGTNCGLRLKGKPVFSVQHHPEASPGPQDSHYLFRRFINMVRETKGEPALAER